MLLGYKMRKFKDYLNDDINKFRNLKVGLVRTRAGEEVVSRVKEEFDLGIDLIELINELNFKLKKSYTGKFKFDFCLIEDINIDRLKVKNRSELIDRLKEKVFKVSDSLAKSQTQVEREIESLRDS